MTHNREKTIRAVLAVAFAVLGIAVVPAAAEEKPAPNPEQVEIGVASWNIERFDAAGPDDRTFPRRSRVHLEMIAETLLETGTDVIGLQEVVPSRSPSGPFSLDQLVAELNRLAKERKGQKDRGSVWKGEVGKSRMGDIYTALLWNTETLDLMGEVTELTDLKRGYGFGKKVRSKDELRFPRAPLAGRFRVKAAPENDFVVIVLHLKARNAGLWGGLDENDIRRRGEWEDLIREWFLKPEIQGGLRDDDVIVLGDMNERNGILVELLDRHGTADDVRGRLILSPSDFSDPDALFLFTSAVLEYPTHFTFKYNAEKGERGKTEDYLGDSSNFLDHIVISRSLLDSWDGKYRIGYFENHYPLRDHVKLSDHRPVSIRLRFPKKAK